jgi:hypothetical protein
MIKYIPLALGAVLLIAFLYQRSQIKSLSSELQGEREKSARFIAAANENAATLNAVKRDFNASLNDCYEDYKTIAGAFDRYRAAITNAQKRQVVIADKNVSCRLVKNAPLIEALNRSNQ